jgi:hypothetical protein
LDIIFNSLKLLTLVKIFYSNVMKYTLKTMMLVLTVLSCFTQSCKNDSLPKIITSKISKISAISAQSGGSCSEKGTGQILLRGVCWSKESLPTINLNKTIDGDGSGPYQSEITGLESSTKYYVRAYAIVDQDVIYGEELSFTTKPSFMATVTTSKLSITTAEDAVLDGKISFDGNSPVTERGIVYSTSLNPTTSDNKISAGIGVGTFSVYVSNLLANTTYYLRTYATNFQGTAYGSNVSINTIRGDEGFITASAIAEIQGTENNSPLIGQYRGIYGTVTGAIPGSGYFIQDGSASRSGIWVPDSSGKFLQGIGVKVEGYISEENNVTSLIAAKAQVITTPFTITPVVINSPGDAKQEKYESVLVKVEGVRFNGVPNADGSWVVRTTESNFITVGNSLFKYVPVNGHYYHVSGIVHVKSDLFILEPREEADIVDLTVKTNPATEN